MRVKLLIHVFVCIILASCSNTNERPKNIIFIAIDDLRPQLNSAGKDYMHTPNLNNLSSDGTQFLRHYVQVPTCGASRHSMLTGQRPQNRQWQSNEACKIFFSEDNVQKHTSFVELLRKQGYYTSGIGKISHYPDGKLYSYSGEGNGEPEMPNSWDKMGGPVDKWGTAWNAFFGYSDGTNRNSQNREVRPYEKAKGPDTILPDGVIAEMALKEIDSLSKIKNPFFLAIGFFKPHLPFNAPEKYWDLYDENSIPLSPSPNLPENGLRKSLHNSGELFNSYKIQEEKGGIGVQIGTDYAKKLRHAYFASVSYTDAQVGKVIQKLKEKGLYENSLIIVWGDHGWFLGDHSLWGKHSLYDGALRSTLIFKHPESLSKGQSSNTIVESVDIFPTIMDFAGIPQDSFQSDGNSLISIIKNPSIQFSKPAISFWRDGLSIRTDEYRYIEYGKDSLKTAELYNLGQDYYEKKNILNERTNVAEELAAIASKYKY